jgi:dihydroorotate dehydrogenase electron transfer subunit
MKHFPALKVLGQEMVAQGYFRLQFLSLEIAGQAKPGQFLHVRIAPGWEPFLRRPFSVQTVDRENGTVCLFYRAVGRGTRMLAKKKKGDFLDVIGPLGRGFTLPAPGQRVVLVAGGMGIAPLFFLFQELAGLDNLVFVLIGARTGKELLLVEEVRELGKRLAQGRQTFFPEDASADFFKFSPPVWETGVLVATDDGSNGYQGPVTDLLARLLAGQKVDLVYACGPPAMLKVAGALLDKYGVEGEFSLEERMGCGVGACLSCVCKTKKAGTGQDFSYRRVCFEGPVFRACEIVW